MDDLMVDVFPESEPSPPDEIWLDLAPPMIRCTDSRRQCPCRARHRPPAGTGSPPAPNPYPRAPVGDGSRVLRSLLLPAAVHLQRRASAVRETADGGPRCLGWQRCGSGSDRGPASDPLAPRPSELAWRFRVLPGTPDAVVRRERCFLSVWHGAKYAAGTGDRGGNGGGGGRVSADRRAGAAVPGLRVPDPRELVQHPAGGRQGGVPAPGAEPPVRGHQPGAGLRRRPGPVRGPVLRPRGHGEPDQGTSRTSVG